MKQDNKHTSRETWLQSATNGLRPYFEKFGYTLPDKIRFAIAFTSGGKKGMAGECWRPQASADHHYEIIIKADRDDPVDILGILVRQLIHVILPPDAKHGKEFKAIATRVGMEGNMREATPGPLLRERLVALAESLGPLPHGKLDFATRADAPKKSGVRMLKAECNECGYNIRILPKWIKKIGLPMCPASPEHGTLACNLPEDENDDVITRVNFSKAQPKSVKPDTPKREAD